MNSLRVAIHPAVTLLVLWAVASSGGAAEIPLWPHGAPGSEGKTGDETVRVTDGGEHVISNIHRPSITPYLPAAGEASGAAVIVAPGGGHRELWSDHEGHNVARWLKERGVAAFVLKYRLAREPNSTYTVDDHSLADMQRAIRLVRSRAQEWHINPSRVGVMGFSAGGEVAALAAMHNDAGDKGAVDIVERQSSRPDYQALIYPGRSSRYEASKDSPPVFIVCGYGDRPDISKGMAELYLKYKEVGVPAELHIYAKAGHGFGQRERTRGAVAGWPDRLYEWMQDLQNPDREGFVSIFDGKTLNGWKGDSTYWSVRDGAIFGEITPETVVDRNTFLIWQGDMPPDFELKVEYRVSSRGNSGINYRSELVEGVPHALKGYQADIDGRKRHIGSNYEERGRTTLAYQGEIVVVSNAKDSGSLELYRERNNWKARETTGSLGSREFLQSKVKDGDWNEYHLIVNDNRMKHIVNGVLMSDVTDNDLKNRRTDGMLGVQVHVGPPMTIEYRHFRIKKLN